MYGWRNFVDKTKRYFPLEGFEKKGLIVTILVFSFLFSFREWGTEKFDFSMGIGNLIIITTIVTISFLVHEIAHRTIALWLGYHSQYKAWLIGLVAGLIVTFVSNGRLLFLAPGALVITHLTYHRLGKPYYELSMKHLGWIAMSGPIANMLFAVILKTISLGIPSPILTKAVAINIWIALYDMLPVPPFNGHRTFFGSRYIYMFVIGSLIGCAALLTFVSGILPIIGAIIIGALLLLVFFVYIDKRFKK